MVVHELEDLTQPKHITKPQPDIIEISNSMLSQDLFGANPFTSSSVKKSKVTKQEPSIVEAPVARLVKRNRKIIESSPTTDRVMTSPAKPTEVTVACTKFRYVTNLDYHC